MRREKNKLTIINLGVRFLQESIESDRSSLVNWYFLFDRQLSGNCDPMAHTIMYHNASEEIIVTSRTHNRMPMFLIISYRSLSFLFSAISIITDG